MQAAFATTLMSVRQPWQSLDFTPEQEGLEVFVGGLPFSTSLGPSLKSVLTRTDRGPTWFPVLYDLLCFLCHHSLSFLVLCCISFVSVAFFCPSSSFGGGELASPTGWLLSKRLHEADALVSWPSHGFPCAF